MGRALLRQLQFCKNLKPLKKQMTACHLNTQFHKGIEGLLYPRQRLRTLTRFLVLHCRTHLIVSDLILHQKISKINVIIDILT